MNQHLRPNRGQRVLDRHLHLQRVLLDIRPRGGKQHFALNWSFGGCRLDPHRLARLYQGNVFQANVGTNLEQLRVVERYHSGGIARRRGRGAHHAAPGACHELKHSAGDGCPNDHTVEPQLRSLHGQLRLSQPGLTLLELRFRAGEPPGFLDLQLQLLRQRIAPLAHGLNLPLKDRAAPAQFLQFRLDAFERAFRPLDQSAGQGRTGRLLTVEFLFGVVCASLGGTDLERKAGQLLLRLGQGRLGLGGQGRQVDRALHPQAGGGQFGACESQFGLHQLQVGLRLLQCDFGICVDQSRHGLSRFDRLPLHHQQLFHDPLGKCRDEHRRRPRLHPARGLKQRSTRPMHVRSGNHDRQHRDGPGREKPVTDRPAEHGCKAGQHGRGHDVSCH